MSIKRRSIPALLLLFLLLLTLAGCGLPYEPTVLTDEMAGQNSSRISSALGGEAVFGEGKKDTASGELPSGDSVASEESAHEENSTSDTSHVEDDTSHVEDDTSHVEDDTSKKEGTFFLARLLHREPTTLDDTEREIQRHARLVYLIFEDSWELSKEKSLHLKKELTNVGCTAVVHFCGGSPSRLEGAFVEAMQAGAGTIVFEMRHAELPESLMTEVQNAGIRLLSIGKPSMPDLATSAVTLPDESSGVPGLSLLASQHFSEGQYLVMEGDPEKSDLALQFGDALDRSLTSLEFAGFSPAASEDEEVMEKTLSKALSNHPDTVLLLCPDTFSALMASKGLRRAGRMDVAVYCLFGEGSILELLDQNQVDAALSWDTQVLARTVLNAVDALAEKGKAGDYALSYVPTVLRPGEA